MSSSEEEVSENLLKSVKELADWEFPLSQTLEKYKNQLQNSREIRYDEAALILQNCSEAFTRRVDSLSKEVCDLSKNILENEPEKEKAKSKGKKSRKSNINFDNFELVDFRKEIGKNINLKPSSQKPVKLLRSRILELEAATREVRNPIKILDIHGEIIGNKYDFRCNQELNFHGLLVDELNPSDFEVVNIRAADSEEIPETTQENLESNMEIDYAEDLFPGPTYFDDSAMNSNDDTEELQNSEAMEDNTNPIETETVANESDSTKLNPFVNQVETIATDCQPGPSGIQSTDETNQDQREDADTSGSIRDESGYLSDKSETFQVPQTRGKRKKDMPHEVNCTPRKQRKSRNKNPCYRMSSSKSTSTSRKRKPPAKGTKRKNSSKFVRNESPEFSCSPIRDHSTIGNDAELFSCPSPGMEIFDSNLSSNMPTVSETFQADNNEESPPDTIPNYQQIIELRLKEVHDEMNVRTDLEHNVAEWHKMIRPKLEQVERRPRFDIHEYGNRILGKLQENPDNRMLFEKLIVDQPVEEAVRYFSAALQLTNTYQIDLETSERKTDIMLTLLSEDTTREISNETPGSSRNKN